MVLLADLSIGEVLGIISPVVLALVGAIAALFKINNTLHESQLTKLEIQAESARKEQGIQYEARIRELISQYEIRLVAQNNLARSYREMNDDNLAILATQANKKLADEGKPPFKNLEDVVPFHHSPVTKEQQDAADLATALAKQVAVAIILGVPPRETARSETEEEETARLAKERKTAHDVSKAVVEQVREGVASSPNPTAPLDAAKATVVIAKDAVEQVKEAVDSIAPDASRPAPKPSPEET